MDGQRAPNDALTPASRPTASLRIPADFHPISFYIFLETVQCTQCNTGVPLATRSRPARKCRAQSTGLQSGQNSARCKRKQQQHRSYRLGCAHTPSLTQTECPAKGPIPSPALAHRHCHRPRAIVGSPFVLQRQSDVQE